MLYFTGQLLAVEDGQYKQLTFASEQYDRGLKRMVPCSERISIDDAHLSEMANYQSMIGKTVTVPVIVRPTKKGGLWTVTYGNGQAHAVGGSK